MPDAERPTFCAPNTPQDPALEAAVLHVWEELFAVAFYALACLQRAQEEILHDHGGAPCESASTASRR